MQNKAKLYAIGMGPGNFNLVTEEAKIALAECDIIVGYKAYIENFSALFSDKKVVKNSMRGEMERCEYAISQVQAGKSVTVISSGDAGIYGMAGLLLELLEEKKLEIELKTIPGITAATAAAAILGAPLMNDFATISLSNLLTPSSIIKKRLEAIASADMVCVIYNPKSKKRQTLLQEAVDIFSESAQSDLCCGIVQNASKENESHQLCRLSQFPFEIVDMNTIVVIGNSTTRHHNGKLYTTRGYLEKYSK